MSRLHVLDGTAVLFRAWFAGIDLTAPDGTPVGAVRGLVDNVLRFGRRHRPERLVVVFDAGRLTFRNTLYPAYKASRGLPPDDLVPQLQLAPDAVRALGVPGLLLAGYEADDLMATVARAATERSWHTTLVAIDKDVCQLACERVHVMDPRTHVAADVAAITERFGVPPASLPDMAALCGDSVDDIPGVRGIGAKTAAALIARWPTLEELYAHLDEVPSLPIRGASGLPARLAEARDDAFLFRQLTRLRDDVPHPDLDDALDASAWQGPVAGAEDWLIAHGLGRLG